MSLRLAGQKVPLLQNSGLYTMPARDKILRHDRRFWRSSKDSRKYWLAGRRAKRWSHSMTGSHPLECSPSEVVGVFGVAAVEGLLFMRLHLHLPQFRLQQLRALATLKRRFSGIRNSKLRVATHLTWE
mmetsp:Transcript_47056/g.100725  ORF Transcript_47056/g.100725 Transcript_47056/m.100725 type:complete len:128 (-) Transcript_47056:25-408(-)